MPDPTDHGDHGVTFNFVEVEHKTFTRRGLAASAKPADEAVFDAERAAIQSRREFIRRANDSPKELTAIKPVERDRTAAPLTGLALSGGGIRSASFGLGALQGLHASIGIEGLDYLSTVSGGGYIGCALTTSLQKTRGQFPFTSQTTYADTASVRHIRDFSNYLIPRGGTDIITAVGIILRGLVANAIIVLPIILLCVWITLVSHPAETLLGQPRIFDWNLANGIAALGFATSDPLWGIHGFWFTLLILGLDLVFLIVWVFVKSVFTSQVWQARTLEARRPGDSAELQGGLARLSKILFFITIVAAWFEVQPFILYYTIVEHASVKDSCYYTLSVASLGQCFGSLVRGWIGTITPLLAPIGTIIAFLSKYLGDLVVVAKRTSGLVAWVKKLFAKAAIWLAAIIIPSLLWLLYLGLSYVGIRYEHNFANVAVVQTVTNWLPWLGPTVTARLTFQLFLVTLIMALFVNPNTTSLYRLYRDRLSKAFLFDPVSRDRHGDLSPLELKLHQINTDLCPYPIVNAALNIEGSQFVNKRGRNADFFMFTPEYTGSDATGYVGTKLIEHEESALDLGTALAISAAAVSSNMGSQTIRPLSLTLALLNVRLGYWLRNPRWIVGKRSLLKRLLDVRSFLLLKEMFNLITESSYTVYLTDGGNIENLGLYSLLKRKCPVIVVVDAEADPTMSFGSFLLLERYARIDLGVIIDLPWQAVRNQTVAFDKAFEQFETNLGVIPAATGPHCAAGEIQYGPGQSGILFYVKASLTGDESDYVLNYRRRNPDFPHETTSDQFFGEEQLETYRALGFHIVKNALSGDAPFAVKAGTEATEEEARVRILTAIHKAFRGG
jgi:hypothetical protein